MMRWLYFIVLQFIFILIIGIVVYQHKDNATIIKLPPKELAQWYKPDNKRQVWLHNMFKLRREIQAVQYYAEQKDEKHLGEWTLQLNEHYLKIAEMVPRWKKKIDISIISTLQTNVIEKNYSGVLAAINTLQKNCDSCHTDYQAITALTYRAPDFSTIEITPSLSFTSHMQTLINNVNQIKIAATDDMPDIALSSLADLEQGMKELGQVCVNCHKQDKKSYPDQQMRKTILSLKQSLLNGKIKEQGVNLGTLAVQACATCHGTHRLAFGVKKLLTNDLDLKQLLSH